MKPGVIDYDYDPEIQVGIINSSANPANVVNQLECLSGKFRPLFFGGSIVTVIAFLRTSKARLKSQAWGSGFTQVLRCVRGTKSGCHGRHGTEGGRGAAKASFI